MEKEDILTYHFSEENRKVISTGKVHIKTVLISR